MKWEKWTARVGKNRCIMLVLTNIVNLRLINYASQAHEFDFCTLCICISIYLEPVNPRRNQKGYENSLGIKT